MKKQYDYGDVVKT